MTIEKRIARLEKIALAPLNTSERALAIYGPGKKKHVKKHVKRSPNHEKLSDDTRASTGSKLTVGQVKSIKKFATLDNEPDKLNYQHVAFLVGVHNKTVYDVLLGKLHPNIK